MKKILAIMSLLVATSASANQTPIVGIVESKCSIFTETQGVYGAPLPGTLSTDRADGGVKPIIRYDVAEGGYYIAKISYPNEFTTSPNLTDNVTWTGSVAVNQVTDPLMSGYDTNKVTYNNVTEFDLTVAGTVWFEANSTAEYGVDTPFPAGTYTAMVTAECIAK